MSLHILHSHRLDYLFEAFVHVGFQAQSDVRQVLQAKQVIVPNDAVQEWLKIKLADAIGISANIQFHQGITSFQWFIYQHLAQKRDDVRDANLPRLVMKWQIYQYLSHMIQADVLQIDEQHPLANILQRIYQRGSHFKTSTQRYQARQRMLYWVAEQTSQVFGYYLLYRPTWLNIWSAGQRLNIEECVFNTRQNATSHELDIKYIAEIEQWQSVLWHQLFAQRYGQMRQVDAVFWHNLQQRLAQGKFDLHSPLMVFTLLNLAPTQLEFLRNLAQHIDVVIFYFSPTQEYWADSVDPRWKQQQDLKIKQRIRQKHPEFSEQQFQDYFTDLNQHFNAEIREARHPLLTRLGKQARDHFSLLSYLSGGEQNERWIDLFNDPLQGEPVFAQGILGQLQQDIFYLIDPIKQQYHLDAHDQSLQIHICHSVIRQLEVLKEQVLYWLAQGTAEQPRSPQDILVIVPDLLQLEPSIRSLFYSHFQQLPIQLIGTSSIHAQQAWQSFIFRIRWQQTRFTIQQFNDWLNLSATQQYYQLQASDCQRIIELLEKAGFKRGFHQQHLQQQLEVEDTDYRFSFEYALNRLALGIAVPELISCSTANGEIISFAQINTDDFPLIEQLLLIFQDFQQHQNWLNNNDSQPISVIEWLQRLLNELDSWQLHGVEHLNIVRDIIKKYDTMLSLSYYTQSQQHAESLKHLSIPLAELLDEIDQQLQQHISYNDSTGAMTFSQIGHIRPLPYRLMILLNLERGVFPARNTPVAFDLIQLCANQLGDRSRLDDHQGAFLDSLLLAQQEVWLFYNGFDAESNEIIEPSSVVQELINHLNHLVYRSDDIAPYTNVHGIQIPSQLLSLFYLHPREPFLPQGFSEPHLKRLQNQWYQLAHYLNDKTSEHVPPHWIDSAPEPQHNTTSTVPLDAQQWLKELEFPAQALLHHFNIANMRGAELQDEFEPLLLNHLQQYQLYDVMVNDLTQRHQHYQQYQQQDTDNPSPVPTALMLQLPVGHLAQPVLQDSLHYQQKIQHYLQQHQLSITATTQYEWQADNDPLLLTVKLPKVLSTHIWCRVFANKVRGKYRLRIWLQHLLWLAMLDLGEHGQTHQSIAVMQDGILITDGINSTQAKYYLQQWVMAWRYAQNTPLLLSASLVLDNLFAKDEKNWLVDAHSIRFSEELTERLCSKWQTTQSLFNIEQNESNRAHLDWRFILQQLDDAELLQKNCLEFAHLYYPMTRHQHIQDFT